MQFFASVSYIKPFFLILVSLCVVMFQCPSDVVLFHDLPLAMLSFSSFLLRPWSLSFIFPLLVFTLFCFNRIVKLTPSPVTAHYAVVIKHSKYTSKCLYVYYCVAQVAARRVIIQKLTDDSYQISAGRELGVKGTNILGNNSSCIKIQGHCVVKAVLRFYVKKTAYLRHQRGPYRLLKLSLAWHITPTNRNSCTTLFMWKGVSTDISLDITEWTEIFKDSSAQVVLPSPMFTRLDKNQNIRRKNVSRMGQTSQC